MTDFLLRSGASTRHGLRVLLAVLLIGPAALGLAADDAGSKPARNDNDEKTDKASLSLRANPAISFAPARISVTAELRGGSDTDPDLYCPDLEWEWDDSTRSESSQNCEPFVPGESKITRRWSASHTFTTGGQYQIYLRLKRGGKIVLAGSTKVEVRRGPYDPDDF